MDVERWVDERLRLLDRESMKQVSAEKVLARLRNREARRGVVRRRLAGLGIAATVACVGFASALALRSFHNDISPAAKVPAVALANPESQPQTVAALPLESHDKSVVTPFAPSPAPQRHAPAVAPPVLKTNFKEIGSASASVACEIYIDYECPPCAAFYRDTVPLLVAQYVDTGKVRLLRRDFPLPFHRHAMLAAQFANAAGLLGEFQTVTDRIFQTQSQWAQDGDIDRQLAAVLPPENMVRLRRLMKDSHRLDEMIEHDRALAADDHIDQTPTLILAANGKRQKIVNVSSFAVLKASIDEILAQQQ